MAAYLSRLKSTLAVVQHESAPEMRVALSSTHVSEILVTRLGLLASICQSTTRYQVMTRL